MAGLSGNKPLRIWKRPEMLPYQEELNEFDLTLGVKGLIMIRSNLVLTWKVRPFEALHIKMHVYTSNLNTD